jgi:thiol-disulfide isomerase/thioredoxin
MYSGAVASTLTATPTVGADPVTPAVQPFAAPETATATVAAAISRAKVSGRPILLIFGGNWSEDCWFLGGVLALPSVSAWIARNFEVAQINVGRRNMNMDISQKYGVTVELVPTVLVLSSSEKLLNTGFVFSFSHARQMTPQSIVDQLAAWGAKG